MKLSGNTKITIKVPKRLYESIKRQLSEETSREWARGDMSGADKQINNKTGDDDIDRANMHKALKDLVTKEELDWYIDNEDDLKSKFSNIFNDRGDDPDTLYKDVKTWYRERDMDKESGLEEKVTMEELNEAIKQIREAKKKKAEKKPLTRAEIAKAKKAKEAEEEKAKLAKDKKPVETKKKMVDAKKK